MLSISISHVEACYAVAVFMAIFPCRGDDESIELTYRKGTRRDVARDIFRPLYRVDFLQDAPRYCWYLSEAFQEGSF